MPTIEQTLLNAAAAVRTAGGAAYTGAVLANRGVRRLGRSVRRTRDSAQMVLTRSAQPVTVSLVAGAYSGIVSPTLGLVQTSDLIAMYDQYKIIGVKVTMIPLYDPGQSGITNNTDIWVSMSCDPTAQVTAPTWLQVTAFENARSGPLVAGKPFTYTFRPRAINTLAAGSFAVNNSDWLILSGPAAGTSVPHERLLINLTSNLAANVTSFTYKLDITFAVKTAK
jgi:hypothetical protein